MATNPISQTVVGRQKPDGSRIVHPPGMLELLVLLLGALRAGLSSRADLVAEHLLLRQQLAALTRCGGGKVQPQRRRAFVGVVQPPERGSRADRTR